MNSRTSGRLAEEEDEMTMRPSRLRVTPRIQPGNLGEELESLRSAIDSLDSYAGRLEELLDSVAGAEEIEAEIDLMRSTLSDLGTNTLTLAREQRFADEAERISGLLEQAKDAPLEESVDLLRNARRQIVGLAHIMEAEERFFSRGIPHGLSPNERSSLLDALEATISDFGTSNQPRAEAAIRALDIYNNNAAELDLEHARAHRENPDAESLRDDLFGFIHGIGNRAQSGANYSDENKQRDLTFLSNAEDRARTISGEVRNHYVERFQNNLGIVEDAIERSFEENEQRSLEALRTMMQELIDHLNNPYQELDSDEVLRLTLEYHRLTGDTPDLSEDDIGDDIASRIMTLRESRNDEVRQWARLAQEALAQEDYMSADLAVLYGSIEEVTGGNLRRMDPETYESVRQDIASGREISQREYQILRRLGDVCLMLSQLDRIRQEYPRMAIARRESDSRQMLRIRRDRYNDAADAIEQRLREGRIDDARRLLQMTMQYLEILNRVPQNPPDARENFPGREQITEALSREISGYNASDLFNQGASIFSINSRLDELEDVINLWGRPGFRSTEMIGQRRQIERFIDFSREQAEDDIEVARQLLGFAIMYVDAMERMGQAESIGGNRRIVSTGDWNHNILSGHISRAMEDPASIDDTMSRSFAAEWADARRLATFRNIERLEEMVAERCIVLGMGEQGDARQRERSTLDAVLDEARIRADSGDFERSDTLIRMVDDYFGENADRHERIWIQDGQVPGYARGRDLMLNGLVQAADANNDRALSSAIDIFTRGTASVNSTRDLLRASAPIARGHEQDEAVSSDSELPALTQDLQRAAAQGNPTAFGEALERVVERRAELQQDRQLAQMRRVLTQLGRQGAEHEIPDVETTTGFEVAEEDQATGRRVSLYDAVDMWARASGRPITSRAEGGFPPYREFEQLLARRNELLGRMDEEGMSQELMDDYNLLVLESQRFYRRANAYVVVRRELEANNQYLVSVRAVTTGSPSASQLRAIEHLEAANADLRRAQMLLERGSISGEIQGLIDRRFEAEELEQQIYGWTGWDTDPQLQALRDRHEEVELSPAENRRLRNYLRGPSLSFAAAMEHRAEAMTYWGSEIQNGDLQFYVDARSAFFDNVFLGEGDPEQTNFREGDSRCMLLEQGIFGMPEQGYHRVADRFVHFIGNIGRAGRSHLDQVAEESRHDRIEEETGRRPILRPGATDELARMSGEEEPDWQDFESAGEMQQGLIALARDGSASVSDMTELTREMIGRDRYSQLAAHVGEFAVAVASMPISPLFGSAMFLTGATRGAFTEFNTTGHVSPTTLVMIGGIALTMGVGSMASAYANAARTARAMAAARGEMSVIETAMRYGRIAHYLERTNLAAGGLFSLTMMHSAHQMADAGLYVEAFAYAGMAAFPFVHMGANAVARRHNLQRVPRWMRVGQREMESAVPENVVQMRTQEATESFFMREDMPRAMQADRAARAHIRESVEVIRRSELSEDPAVAESRGRVESARQEVVENHRLLEQSLRQEMHPNFERRLARLNQSIARLRAANEALAETAPEFAPVPSPTSSGGAPQPAQIPVTPAIGGFTQPGDTASMHNPAVIDSLAGNLASNAPRNSPVTAEAAVGRHVVRGLPRPAQRIVSNLVADSVARQNNLGDVPGLTRYLSRLEQMSTGARSRSLESLPTDVRAVVADQRAARPQRTVDEAAVEITRLLGRRQQQVEDAASLIEGTLPAWMIDAISSESGGAAPAQLRIGIDGRPVVPVRTGGRRAGRQPGRRPRMRADEARPEETTTPGRQPTQDQAQPAQDQARQPAEPRPGIRERIGRRLRRLRRQRPEETEYTPSTEYQRFLDEGGLIFAHRLARGEQQAVQDAARIIIRLYDMHAQGGSASAEAIGIIEILHASPGVRQLMSDSLAFSQLVRNYRSEIASSIAQRYSQEGRTITQDDVIRFFQNPRQRLPTLNRETNSNIRAEVDAARSRLNEIERIPERLPRLLEAARNRRAEQMQRGEQVGQPLDDAVIDLQNLARYDLPGLIRDARHSAQGEGPPRLLNENQVRMIVESLEGDPMVSRQILDQTARRIFGVENIDTLRSGADHLPTMRNVAAAEAGLQGAGIIPREVLSRQMQTYTENIRQQATELRARVGDPLSNEIITVIERQSTNRQMETTDLATAFRRALRHPDIRARIRERLELGQQDAMPEWYTRITEGDSMTMPQIIEALQNGGAFGRSLSDVAVRLRESPLNDLIMARNEMSQQLSANVAADSGTVAAAEAASRYNPWLRNVNLGDGALRVARFVGRLYTLRTLPGPVRAYHRVYPGRGAGFLRGLGGVGLAAGSVAGNALITGAAWAGLGVLALYLVDRHAWRDSREGRARAMQAYQDAARAFNDENPLPPGVALTEERSYPESFAELFFGNEQAVNADDVRELGRLLAEDILPIRISDENSEFLSTGYGEQLISQLTRSFEEYPSELLRPPSGLSVEAGAARLRQILSATDEDRTVVDPEMLNQLLTDARQIAEDLPDINRYLGQYRDSEDGSAAQRRAYSSLETICQQHPGLDADDLIRQGSSEIDIGGLISLRRPYWVSQNYLLTRSDFVARTFALDTGVHAGNSEEAVAANLPLINDRIIRYQNTRSYRSGDARRNSAESQLRRTCNMFSLDYDEVSRRFRSEGSLTEDNIPGLMDEAAQNRRRQIEWLADHPEVMVYLWTEYTRGHIPRSFMADALGELMSRDLAGTLYEDVGHEEGGSAYEGVELDLTQVSQERVNALHDLFTDALQNPAGEEDLAQGEELYLEAPISSNPDSFLERIDYQSINDSSMGEAFIELVRTYSEREDWDRLRNFRIDTSYAIYGETIGGERSLRRIADIIIENEDDAAAINQLREEGYISPVLYTVEGSGMHLGDLDPAFRWNRRSVQFVYEHSEGNREGIAHWLAVNHEGLMGRAHGVVEFLLEPGNVDPALLRDMDRIEPYLDRLIGTPDNPGRLFRYWNPRIPTPLEDEAEPDERSTGTMRQRHAIQGRGATGRVAAADARRVDDQIYTPGSNIEDSVAAVINDESLSGYVNQRLLYMGVHTIAVEESEWADNLEEMGIFVHGTIRGQGDERRLTEFNMIPFFADAFWQRPPEEEGGEPVTLSRQERFNRAEDRIRSVFGIPDSDELTGDAARAMRLARYVLQNERRRSNMERKFEREVHHIEQRAPNITLSSAIAGDGGLIETVIDQRIPPINSPELRSAVRSAVIRDLKANINIYMVENIEENGFMVDEENDQIMINENHRESARQLISRLVDEQARDTRMGFTSITLSGPVEEALDRAIAAGMEVDFSSITEDNREQVRAAMIADMQSNDSYRQRDEFEINDNDELVFSESGSVNTDESFDGQNLTAAEIYLRAMATITADQLSAEEE